MRSSLLEGEKHVQRLSHPSCLSCGQPGLFDGQQHPKQLVSSAVSSRTTQLTLPDAPATSAYVRVLLGSGGYGITTLLW
jgi:hypothetical protein